MNKAALYTATAANLSQTIAEEAIGIWDTRPPT